MKKTTRERGRLISWFVRGRAGAEDSEGFAGRGWAPNLDVAALLQVGELPRRLLHAPAHAIRNQIRIGKPPLRCGAEREGER